jgi:hypothetical protein
MLRTVEEAEGCAFLIHVVAFTIHSRSVIAFLSHDSATSFERERRVPHLLPTLQLRVVLSIDTFFLQVRQQTRVSQNGCGSSSDERKPYRLMTGDTTFCRNLEDGMPFQNVAPGNNCESCFYNHHTEMQTSV